MSDHIEQQQGPVNQRMRAEFDAWLEQGIEEADACRPADNVVEAYFAVWQAAIAANEEAQPVEPVEPVTWGAPKTVAHLIRQLQTMEPEIPVHGAIFVGPNGRRKPKIRPLSLSRERVDGQWIKQGDESIPYQLVVWTAEQPTSTKPAAALPRYDVFSQDDGDSWEKHPASDCFVHGRKLGDEFELLAGWTAERVTFRVTKAPDEESDDYEVEQVTPQSAAHPAVVQDGWKLVPVEPTDEMLDAGIDADSDGGALTIYRAMLAAAPKLETQEHEVWRDIESAPRDGRTILLGYFNGHGNWRTLRGQWFTKEVIDNEWEDADLFEAGWYETSVEADDTPSCWPTNPTNWMPVPAAPKPEGGTA